MGFVPLYKHVELQEKAKNLPPKKRKEVEDLLDKAFYWHTQSGGAIYEDMFLRRVQEILEEENKGEA